MCVKRIANVIRGTTANADAENTGMRFVVTSVGIVNNMFKLAKFFIEHMVKDALTSAGNEIGTAIGKRISKHIHTEPEKEEKDDDDKSDKPEPDETVH
jgi:hypothetical protein